MKTFAQIVNGHALNVVLGETSAAALKGTYGDEWVAKEIAAGRPWIEVPEGTKPNAKTDGKGNWEAPAEPAAAPAPAVDPVCARMDAMQNTLNKIAEKLGVEVEA